MATVTNKKFIIACLVVILALAAFLRFYALDRIPPGIYPDEAIKGNEGLEAVRTGDFKIFYPTNNGREGLWINLIGVSVAVFGNTQFALRFWPAFFGTLTVLFLYLLARELFGEQPTRDVIPASSGGGSASGGNAGIQSSGSRIEPAPALEPSSGMTTAPSFRISRGERIGLLAAFFLATSFWHLNFSRIVFRAILVPFLMTASLWLLLAAWRRAESGIMNHESWIRIALFLAGIGGVLYGLGFHTYIVFRFTPFVVLALFVVEFFRRRRANEALKPWLATTAIWLGVAFLVALPIGLYFLNHPQDFFGRAGGVSIFSVEKSLREFGAGLVKTLGMFNIRGDCNWRHNMACSPQLILPVGLLFLLGFWLVLKEIFRKRSLEIRYWILVIWFFVLLLPELLTREGIPHALRAIGVIPPVMIFAAIGADALLVAVIASSDRGRNEAIPRSPRFARDDIRAKTLVTVLVMVIVGSGAVEIYRYFGVWAKNPNTAGAFTRRLVDIGEYLNTLPADTPRYVVVNDPGVLVPHTNPDGKIKNIPMPAQTVLFVTQNHPPATYLLPEDVAHTDFPAGSVIIPLLTDERVFSDVRNRGLQIKETAHPEFVAGAVE